MQCHLIPLVRKPTMMHFRLLGMLLFTVLFKQGLTQMTIRVTEVPQYFTPLLDTLYIAGNFNSWAAGDAAYQLTPQPDGSYTIALGGSDGDTLEYKFTRGDWARVETQSDGSFLSNRVSIYNTGSTVDCVIADWDDTNGSHTIAGNVFELDYNFFMPQYNRVRRIWMYLPPDYFTSTEHYPVVYMHDGQNVFDQASSFAGEWDADGTMQTLISGGHTKAIIVGIANGEVDRIDEYTPWAHPSYGGGDGERYADFLVETLKPYIDAHYRTLPERENTVIGGSSLGGLISYYAALQYDSVFGKAFIFSPSFWYSDSVNAFTNQFEKNDASKFYFMAGLYEDVDMVPDMELIYDEMEAVGFTPAEYISVIRADGAHSEWFWKRELDEALLWLFENIEPLSAEALQPLSLVRYDSVMQQFHIQGDAVVQYQLFDMMGKLVQQGSASTTISMQAVAPGSYMLYYNTQSQYGIARCVVH